MYNNKQSIVVHTYNLTAWDAKVGKSPMNFRSAWLPSEFQTSLSYSPCLNTKQKEDTNTHFRISWERDITIHKKCSKRVWQYVPKHIHLFISSVSKQHFLTAPRHPKHSSL